TRESDPRGKHWRRRSQLHAARLRYRLRLWRLRRSALCAAGRVHRSRAIRARAVAAFSADGRGWRRGILRWALHRRRGRGPPPRVASLRAELLPAYLRRYRHRDDGVLPDRHCRAREANLRRAPARCTSRACARARDEHACARGGQAVTAPVLEVRGIKKNFGGVRAVNGVSFDVYPGEILGLIGPNGSGKSTLFNCILGQFELSEGVGKVDGEGVTGLRASALNRRGVGRTFQLLQVFPQLSVRENLILAGQEHQGTMLGRLFGRRDVGLGATAERMIEFFRLGHLAHERAGGLSYGQQK